MTSRILHVLREVNSLTKISVWRFSTDGVYSAGIAGFKTIGIGPGDEALVHKPNGYVEVKTASKSLQSIFSNHKEVY